MAQPNVLPGAYGALFLWLEPGVFALLFTSTSSLTFLFVAQYQQLPPLS